MRPPSFWLSNSIFISPTFCWLLNNHTTRSTLHSTSPPLSRPLRAGWAMGLGYWPPLPMWYHFLLCGSFKVTSLNIWNCTFQVRRHFLLPCIFEMVDFTINDILYQCQLDRKMLYKEIFFIFDKLIAYNKVATFQLVSGDHMHMRVGIATFWLISHQYKVTCQTSIRHHFLSLVIKSLHNF